MITLIADKALRYAGQSYQPGETFEARTERDARLLTAIGKANYAEDDHPQAHHSAGGSSEAAPPMRRGRGRPRKYPMPAARQEPAAEQSQPEPQEDSAKAEEVEAASVSREDAEAEEKPAAHIHHAGRYSRRDLKAEGR